MKLRVIHVDVRPHIHRITALKRLRINGDHVIDVDAAVTLGNVHVGGGNQRLHHQQALRIRNMGLVLKIHRAGKIEHQVGVLARSHPRRAAVSRIKRYGNHAAAAGVTELCTHLNTARTFRAPPLLSTGRARQGSGPHHWPEHSYLTRTPHGGSHEHTHFRTLRVSGATL